MLEEPMVLRVPQAKHRFTSFMLTIVLAIATVPVILTVNGYVPGLLDVVGYALATSLWVWLYYDKSQQEVLSYNQTMILTALLDVLHAMPSDQLLDYFGHSEGTNECDGCLSNTQTVDSSTEENTDE